MLEGQLQSVCIDWLQIQENQGNLWFSRINMIPPVTKVNGKMTFRRMSKGSKTGIADLFIFSNCRTIWIEFKSDKGKQSDNQKDFEQAITKYSNSEYYVVKELDELKEILA